MIVRKGCHAGLGIVSSFYTQFTTPWLVWLALVASLKERGECDCVKWLIVWSKEGRMKLLEGRFLERKKKGFLANNY